MNLIAQRSLWGNLDMKFNDNFILRHVGFGVHSYQENLSILFKALNVKSMLDLGAGKNEIYEMCKTNMIKQLLLDLNYPEEKSHNLQRLSISIIDHLEVLQAIVDFTAEDKVDAVICIQTIEHLSRQEGLFLLENICNYARKLVVVETPNGFVYQEGTKDNPFQAHLSGWNYEDFQKLGYSVVGTFGLKILRHDSNKGALKFNIKGLRKLELFFCKWIIFRFFPKFSYNIFAYKIL